MAFKLLRGGIKQVPVPVLARLPRRHRHLEVRVLVPAPDPHVLANPTHGMANQRPRLHPGHVHLHRYPAPTHPLINQVVSRFHRRVAPPDISTSPATPPATHVGQGVAGSLAQAGRLTRVAPVHRMRPGTQVRLVRLVIVEIALPPGPGRPPERVRPPRLRPRASPLPLGLHPWFHRHRVHHWDIK